MRFQIDWASLKVEVNLLFLLSFTLYLRAIFQVQALGACIWRDNLTEGFLRYRFGGLILGGTINRGFVCYRFGGGLYIFGGTI